MTIQITYCISSASKNYRSKGKVKKCKTTTAKTDSKGKYSKKNPQLQQIKHLHINVCHKYRAQGTPEKPNNQP